MKRASFAVMAFALIPASALAANLPLEDGNYAQGKCNSGSADFTKSFDIQTVSDGPKMGRRYLYPEAENQEGSCITGKTDVSGNRFSGSAKCEGGGSRIQYTIGTYRFSLQVLSSRSFVSKGKMYVWCASHR